MAHLLIAFIITSASVATKPGKYCTKGTFVLLAAHASTQNHLRSCVPPLGTPHTGVKRTSASPRGLTRRLQTERQQRQARTLWPAVTRLQYVTANQVRVPDEQACSSAGRTLSSQKRMT